MKPLMFLVLLICHLQAYGKPVTVGVLEFSPPFVLMSASGNGTSYYGFKIDLMNAICEQMHRECKYKPLDMSELYSSLDKEEVDVLLAPTPIPSTNDSNYLFSLPYLASNAQFVTLESNDQINSLMDLKGKRVGALKYSLYDELLEKKFQNFYVLRDYSKITDMATALYNKDIDAAVLNASVAKYVVSNYTKATLKFVGNEIPVGQGYGIVSLKENAALIEQINDALLKIEADGTYLKIYKTYFSN